MEFKNEKQVEIMRLFNKMAQDCIKYSTYLTVSVETENFNMIHSFKPDYIEVNDMIEISGGNFTLTISDSISEFDFAEDEETFVLITNNGYTYTFNVV